MRIILALPARCYHALTLLQLTTQRRDLKILPLTWLNIGASHYRTVLTSCLQQSLRVLRRLRLPYHHLIGLLSVFLGHWLVSVFLPLLRSDYCLVGTRIPVTPTRPMNLQPLMLPSLLVRRRLLCRRQLFRCRGMPMVMLG